MSISCTHRFTLVLVSLVAGLILVPGASAATAVSVLRSTPRTVVTFDTATPGTIATSVPLTGIDVAQEIIGIDRSPKDGVVYAIAANLSTNAAYLYTLDPFTGVATLRAPLGAAPGDDNPYTSYAGSEAGDVDVDPVTGELRVFTSLRESWRVSVANGLVSTDTSVGVANTFSAIAYDNNVASAASRTAYLPNFTTDSLYKFTNTATGAVTAVSASGFVHGGATVQWGMDVGADGAAWIVGADNADQVNALFSVDLANGASTRVGAIGTGATPAGDFTILPNVVSVRTATATAAEGSVATIRLQRVGAAGTTRVDWTSSPLSGDAADVPLSGSATFAPGVTELDVAIPVTDDAVFEPEERMAVTFSASTAPATLDGVGLVVPTQNSTTLTIPASDVPAPVQVPMPDKLAPFGYALPIAPLKLAAFVKRGVAPTFFFSEQVKGVATIKLGTKTIATTPITSAKAAVFAKRLTASKAGAALLRKARGKRIALTLLVTVKDAAGNPTAYKRTFVLVR